MFTVLLKDARLSGLTCNSRKMSELHESHKRCLSLAQAVLCRRALDGVQISKRNEGDRRDHPEEISDQQPEYDEEGHCGQQAGCFGRLVERTAHECKEDCHPTGYTEVYSRTRA